MADGKSADSGVPGRALPDSNLARSLDVYWALVRARTRSDLSYRVSFAIRVVASTTIVSLDYLALFAILSKVPALGGWDRTQITYVYGLSSTAFRLSDAIVGGPMERVATHLQAGSFDRFLIRPVGPFTLLLGEEFSVRRIAQLLSCVVVFLFAVTQADIRWTVGHLLFQAAALIGGFLLFAGLFVIVCSLAFKSPNTQEIANAFTYGGATAAEYPVHIFDDFIRRVTFTVVPVAFTAYLPALVLLEGAPNPMRIPQWFALASPLACLPVLLLARGCWKAGLRSYRSTGS